MFAGNPEKKIARASREKAAIVWIATCACMFVQPASTSAMERSSIVPIAPLASMLVIL